eukprot:TRINITY_DN5019_c0_g1_i1.p1 TRINITY_DN5019_c0_g1~~TRINITY_DN5019_c0_g1_i1.p1  ORF type:complete len:1613 (+),score=493.75 TRINITY_DN5019_c0_g1_i1:36-4841(+)
MDDQLNPLLRSSLRYRRGATFWTQLKAMIKRNLIMKKRTLRQSGYEIILPIMFVVLLLVVPNDIAIFPSTKGSNSWPLGSSDPVPFSLAHPMILAYSPNNNATEHIIGDAIANMGSHPQQITSMGFPTSDALKDFYLKRRLASNETQVWAGISFDGSAFESTQFKYEVIIDSNNIPSTTNLYAGSEECRARPSTGQLTPCSTLLWYSSGFLFLQNAIDQAILSGSSSNSTRIISTRMMPHQAYIYRGTAAIIVYPLYLVMAFTPFLQYMLLKIVTEKEKKLKQGMEVMGLRDVVYWLSWFILYAAIMLVFVCIALLIGIFGGVWKYSDKGIIFLMLYLFGLSTLGIAFIATIFLTNPRAAGGLVSLLMIVMSAVNYGIQSGISQTGSWLLSIFSPMAFSLGITEVLLQEAIGTGSHWNNVDQITGVTNVRSCLIMLTLDTIAYLFLAMYLSRVVPSDAQISKPWWFPIRPIIKYFTKNQLASSIEEFEDVENDANENIERNPKEHPTIDIRGMTKLFKKGCLSFTKTKDTTAVNQLSMKMYHDEIFSLLGHNGAGKTTAISILIGLTDMTRGSVKIGDLDITRDLDLVRREIGFCPQHDLLFDDLTVSEHVELFGAIKGMNADEIRQESGKFLGKMEISEKKDSLANTLSGGTKRKLSLILALLGNPKILFLDEPTTGMDPFSRRKVWELLTEAKIGKTVVLTTHYMDEAEFLSDRVAIMAKGQLKCLGSPLFLKNKFGVHYYLNVEKKENFEISQLEELVHESVDGGRLYQDSQNDVTFSLPLKNIRQFPALFQTMEENSEKFQIGSFGVSLTSLEEVFLRIASTTDEDADHVEYRDEGLDTEQMVAKRPSMMHQTRALATIKYKQFFRRKATVVCTVIVPLVLVLAGALTGRLAGSALLSEPSLTLDGNTYNGFGNKIPIFNFTGNFVPFNLNSGNPALTLVNGVSENSVDDWLVDNPDHMSSVVLEKSTNDILNATISWNSTAVFASPLTLNALTNAQLRAKNSKSEVVVTVTPLGIPKQSLPAKFPATILIGFTIIFPPIQFMATLVKDGQTGFKRQMAMMGLRTTSYWLTCFLTDMSMYGFVSLATFIIVLACGADFSGSAFPAFAIITIESQLSMLLLSYLFSFAFKTPETVFRIASIVYQFTSLIPAMVVIVLSSVSVQLENVARIIHYVCVFIDPPYTLMGTLNFINILPVQLEDQNLPSPNAGDYFKETTIWVAMVACIVHVIIFSAAIYYLDFRRYWRVSKGNDDVVASREQNDEDVLEEIHQVEISGNDFDETAILAKHVRKEFPQGKETQVAVADLCLKIKYGECFGLLGPNGAGKTTSLGILTGDIVPTNGTAVVGGYDIQLQLEKTYEISGFCPQIDPYPEDITGRELLELFAKLKGFSAKEAENLAENFCRAISIVEHQHKPTKEYSGGTKRKLSVGLALISNPKIVYLDEPSAGIDPASKHFLWDVIRHDMRHRATVLTTHSMEEAQALCPRITIMVNGNLQCIGSAQHLKSRFGSGYDLEVKANGDEDIRRAIEEAFPSSQLEESLNGHLRYHIPKVGMPISRVFAILVDLMEEHSIEDYAASQTTLEQVFISFAKKQTEKKEQ